MMRFMCANCRTIGIFLVIDKNPPIKIDGKPVQVKYLQCINCHWKGKPYIDRTAEPGKNIPTDQTAPAQTPEMG